MADFDKELTDKILNASSIGLWRVEFEEGKPPRFYGDTVMDALLGVTGEVTPEERFNFHHKQIHPEDLAMFEEYSNKLAVERTEVVYRYIHPSLGEMYVRCSGLRDPKVTDYFVLYGTHQDISDTIRLEKDKLAETRLAEKTLHLEEQLEIIQTYGKVFNSSYYIDINDDSYVELSTRLPGIKAIVDPVGSAQSALRKVCEFVVLEDYVEGMLEFSDLSTINERLRDTDWISMQFEGVFKRWTEAYFIAAKRDVKGNCEHVIWATMNIEDVKRKELSQQKKLRKMTERAQIANNAKTAFLFNMSHDIRTPMNAIIGYTTLLEKALGDREASAGYISKIKNSSDFLLSLINNVLEMARIESGKSVIEEHAWSLDQLNDSLYSLFEQPMKEKKIKFTLDIDVQHPFIYCDPVKLREVYLNILSNACKYTEENGTVSMTLKELPSEREGYAYFETVVSDTGIGMSEEFLPKLFDEFSRERNVTDSKIEGTGLGMPIVKRLVELMGGTISVESKLGKGTTFVVRLYHKISNKEALLLQKKISISVEPLQGKRILLAEDNALNAEIAIAILDENGFLVDHAEDGVQCVEMLEAHESGYYDVVLMDIQMPRMNGYDAAKAIRENKDAGKASVPIIALTANAFDEDKKTALEAGMNAHLSKPIDVAKMLETIAGLILK